MLLALIGIVLLIIIGAFLILKKIGMTYISENGTKTDYESYSEFKSEVSGFFPDPAPESAKDFKYYRMNDDSD